MSEKNIIPNQIPKHIWDERRFDDIILYTLGSTGSCEREIFINDAENGINDRMNKNTFHKWAKELKSINLIEVNKENKNSIYSITQLGLDELLRRLKLYRLDFETLNKIEQKRIKNYINSIKHFFIKYEIYNSDLKAEFIELANEITYDKLDFFSEEKFNKLLLFTVLNHPKFYPIYTMSSLDFREKYNKSSDTIQENLTEADIQQFLQKIIIEKIYGDKFYCLTLDNEERNLYFRINSTCGDIFQTIMNSQFKKLYNLNSLEIIELNNEWLEDAYNEILNQLVNKFELFNSDLKEPLRNLLNEYKAKLQEDLEKKPTIYPDFIPFYSIMDPKQFQNKPKYDSKIRKELRKSLQEINIKLKNKPDEPEVLLKKSELLFKLDEFQEALRTINRAIKFEPIDISRYLKNKAIILSVKKFADFVGSRITIKGQDQIKIFREYINHTFERPLKIINKAIKHNKDESFLSLLFEVKAGFLYFSEKYDEGLNYIDQAIEIDNRSPLENKDDIFGYENYHKVKVRFLFRLKREKEAYSLIEKKLKSGDLTLQDKAQIYRMNRKFEKAIEIYDNLIEDNPEDLSLYEEKAQILSNFSKYEESNEIYNFLIEKSKNKRKYLHYRYTNYMNMGNHDKILELIDQNYRNSPKRKVEKLDDLATTFYYKKHYEDELYVLDQLIQLKNDRNSLIRYYYTKSRVLTKLKKYKEALAFNKKLIKQYSPDINEDLRVYSNNASILAKLGDRDNSINEIEKLIKECPDKKGELLYLYGIILMQFQEFEMGIEKLKKSLEMDKNSIKSHIKIAKCYKMLGKYEMSLNNLAKAKKIATEESLKNRMLPPRYYNKIIEKINRKVEDINKGKKNKRIRESN